MPPWLFGVIALVAFAFLLGVTWSFRGTAQKYAPPTHGGTPSAPPPRPARRGRRGRRGALARPPRARPPLSNARMRLGVMGGTFDPIHHGHLVAASEVQSLLGLDEVVFVPTGEPWQKEGRDVAPAEHRYLMTVVATASNPRFTVSRVDIDRDGPDLHHRHPARPARPAPRRRAVLHHRRRRAGPDPVLEGLRRAVRARPVHRRHPPRLRAVRVRPARRPGRPAWRCRPWRSAPPTAATGSRAGEPVWYLVPDGVVQYISKHHLYAAPAPAAAPEPPEPHRGAP